MTRRSPRRASSPPESPPSTTAPTQTEDGSTAAQRSPTPPPSNTVADAAHQAAGAARSIAEDVQSIRDLVQQMGVLSQSREGKQREEEQEKVRDHIGRLLDLIPSSEGLAVLGSLISAAPPPSQPMPEYSRTVCKQFMSDIILRADGPRALMDVVFGEQGGDVDTVTLTKLEKVAMTLSSVPSRMDGTRYYALILPRLFTILNPTPDLPPPRSPTPASHVRAAAFTISRMYRMQRNVMIALSTPSLQYPFFPPTHQYRTRWQPGAYQPTAVHGLNTLSTLLSNSDPSPNLFANVLGDIISPLWALHEFLIEQKTADPVMRELVDGLMNGWARVVGKNSAVAGWTKVVEMWKGWGYDQPWEWAMGPQGPYIRETESSVDGDLLEQHPDPKQVVEMLKAVGRKDVNAEFFVKMLDTYATVHAEHGDTADAMLYLQYVVAMADTLGHTILEKPEHILSFILHALESTVKRIPEAKGPLQKESKSPWKMVDGDSDDEDEKSEGEEEDAEGHDTLASTAVTLLLAVLEANDTFPAATIPILNSIYEHLDSLSTHPSEAVAEAAREARLVLTARRASSMRNVPSKDEEVNQARRKALETYQEALRLVQDPILPVRAHGLTLLRHLIHPPTKKSVSTEDLSIDPALIPGILDVFITAVQDDDSFVYMNAVHGLSAMLQGPTGLFGKGSWVFQRLVDLYVQGLQANPTTADLDKRLRIGEAISQALSQLGPRARPYIHVIISPMLSVTRDSQYPTVLRGSSLSIISQCVNADPLSMLPFYTDLLSLLLDLLSIETVTTGSKAAAAAEAKATTSQLPNGKVPDPADLDPALKDSRLPAFRQSAAYLLATMLHQAAEKGFADNLLDKQLATRMVKVLRYIRDTDIDGRVKAKAKEALEIMDDMVRMKLGLPSR
ncbi:hypothetical protein CALVIDRAFT_533873 [Calocera viscosa TUFC12733]|uniref:RNA polymerase II assembly factor Rtp1 C-terminal domain-containing protein n=1 Tax=Calocera viscosa (strain TUFC12733) TaxID=1330018 RepID=A0A167QTX9_CALVF|nr:hypothetical protein CALVIDRAFT_533873 [Calocera viscosa TUFC12733]